MSDQSTEGALWSLQDGLVGLMVAMSVVDHEIKNIELLSIDRIVDHLPIFAEYDTDRMRIVAQSVFELIEEEEGLDALFGLAKPAIPEKLYETAYAVCCDLAAADGTVRMEELRFLQEMRYIFDLDRLRTSAIEWGSRARHMTG